MNSQTTLLLTLLVLVSFALAQRSERSCPLPPECQDNPCETERCPRYPNATCCPEYMASEDKCIAQFYGGIGGNARRPYDNCFRNINPCTPSTCTANRMCVEDVIPCTFTGCDYVRIKARCELVVQQPPTSCEDVSKMHYYYHSLMCIQYCIAFVWGCVCKQLHNGQSRTSCLCLAARLFASVKYPGVHIKKKKKKKESKNKWLATSGINYVSYYCS